MHPAVGVGVAEGVRVVVGVGDEVLGVVFGLVGCGLAAVVADVVVRRAVVTVRRDEFALRRFAVPARAAPLGLGYNAVQAALFLRAVDLDVLVALGELGARAVDLDVVVQREVRLAGGLGSVLVLGGDVYPAAEALKAAAQPVGIAHRRAVIVLLRLRRRFRLGIVGVHRVLGLAAVYAA